MSQYRNEQEAARARIDALEEKVAERDAQLRDQKVAEAEREAEVARLRRELKAAGAFRPPAPPPRSMATRAAVIVLVAVALCVITGAVMAVVLRSVPPKQDLEQPPTLPR